MRVDLCRFRAFAGLLREVWHDLVIPRGGMGAKSRAAALAHLTLAVLALAVFDQSTCGVEVGDEDVDPSAAERGPDGRVLAGSPATPTRRGTS